MQVSQLVVAQCENSACGANIVNVKLSLCKGCKSARYCSRNCQKEDWSIRHKGICQEIQTRSKLLRELDQISSQSGEVPLHILDKRLEKWRHANIAALFHATIQALELARGLSRAATHVLFVSLIPREDHEGISGKYFEVTEARVIAFKDGHKQVRPSPAFIAQAEQMRAESEHTLGKTVAFAIVAAPPIPGMTCEPIGIQQDVLRMPIDTSWKRTFMDAIREGEGGRKLGTGMYLKD